MSTNSKTLTPVISTEEFKKAKNEKINSGCIKFNLDFVARAELYVAVKKWVEVDSNVLRASIRGGGSGQEAVDFAYDTSNLKDESTVKNILYSVFKPFFEKELGGDYIDGWDYASPTIVVK